MVVKLRVVSWPQSRYYSRNEHKRLVNVPYVDNSYKWAGGGLLSTVNDLTKFGNHRLTFYQNHDDHNKLFLKSSTLTNLLWVAIRWMII